MVSFCHIFIFNTNLHYDYIIMQIFIKNKNMAERQGIGNLGFGKMDSANWETAKWDSILYYDINIP